MKIQLHIERLIVDGVPLSPAEGHILERTVAEELSRLFVEGGLEPISAQAALVKAEPIGMPDPNGTDAFGKAIAKAVYGCFDAPEGGTQTR